MDYLYICFAQKHKILLPPDFNFFVPVQFTNCTCMRVQVIRLPLFVISEGGSRIKGRKKHKSTNCRQLPPKTHGSILDSVRYEKMFLPFIYSVSLIALQIRNVYRSVPSKWDFFIKMRAAFLAPILPWVMKEGERARRQLSFWWKTLILIGHYGSPFACISILLNYLHSLDTQ